MDIMDIAIVDGTNTTIKCWPLRIFFSTSQKQEHYLIRAHREREKDSRQHGKKRL